MISLRKVVAATDFSPPASYAVFRAAMLARERGSTLALVHVMPEAGFDWFGTFGRDGEAGTAFSAEQFAEAALQRLADMARGIEERYGVTCELRLESGRPAQCIVTVAADDADLLVLGARGEHSIRRWFTGSTAQKLLKASPCPVLLVRRAPRRAYARALAPVDFSPNSFAALKTLAAWLPAANFYVAHAFEHPYEGMMRYAGVDENLIKQHRRTQFATVDKELRSFIAAVAANGTSFARHVEHGHANTVIENLVDKLRPDLVALAAHGKSNLERAFLGSVSLHVALESPCDVLVLRGKRFTDQIDQAASAPGDNDWTNPDYRLRR